MSDPLAAKSRKGKEREAPQPDLFDKLIQIQRTKAAQAGVLRPRDRDKERTERPTHRPSSPTLPTSPSRRAQQAAPQAVVSRTDAADVIDDGHRRRKVVAGSPRVHINKAAPRLYNPDGDPVPMRRTAEPDVFSETASSSYGPRNHLASDRGAQHGRLFDHRKDDPVRFNVLRPTPASGGRAAPTPKSSGDNYVSASSTSSYAHSITSSSFTLNSTTDGSSASSALFDGDQPREHASSGAFAQQLKKLYRGITTLESRLLAEDGKEPVDEGRSLKRPNEATSDGEEVEQEKWQKFVKDYKQLAESMHNLLRLTLAPNVPASLRNIPTKYNIITRLWTHAFHKPLESLRRASLASAVALEHLQDYIIFSYNFYAMLLEEPTMESFKSGWLEALGDLARYCMAIAAMTTPASALTEAGTFVSVNEQALSAQTQTDVKMDAEEESLSQIPSVGIAAARALELEPEKERWRCIAREWYAAGLADMPGTGKLHHHLGLLSRDVESEELRSIYHFCKSMTTLHPFPTSRESVLQIWAAPAQARRAQPDSRVADLFVLMHGMLFTNIQLDDFKPVLARFMERLRLEGAEEREWIMMAVTSIAALLEYGKPTGVLRSTGGIGGKDTSSAAQAAAANVKLNMLTQKVDEMEVDDVMNEPNVPSRSSRDGNIKGNGVLNVSPHLNHTSAAPVNEAELPLAFEFALQLTFQMLAFTLQHPTRKSSSFSRPSLNPYNTILLTFLATVMKHSHVQRLLERAIPWDDLAQFFSNMPSSGLNSLAQLEGSVRLTSGCSPLPEDWCLRGMEWGGRRVYERGFWKSGEGRRMEVEVLDKDENTEGQTDGIIEDDNEARSEAFDNNMRWVRIARSAAILSKLIPGFNFDLGTRSFTVSGLLEEKLKQWKEEEHLEHEEEERMRSRRPWTSDAMDVDDDASPDDDGLSDDDESDEDENEEVKALKTRRRELLRMLRSTTDIPRTRSKRSRTRRRARTVSNKLSSRVVPGYTVLVVDTNILLSSLSLFSALVESSLWTILVPLAVVTELDGIARNKSPLGEAASSAINYITTHILSHSLSLKVQTSKGNYLSNLNVRSEEVSFKSDSWERSMDDLILRAAIWQDDHWVDRSALLNAGPRDTSNATRVVLISFDRNLRLKARARQLDAADERDMAFILKLSK